MALIRCPKCNSLFSETKKACLRCGTPVIQEEVDVAEIKAIDNDTKTSINTPQADPLLGVSVAIGWIFGFFLLLVTLGSLTSGNIAASIIYLTGALFLLPPIRNKVYQKTHVMIPPAYRLGIVIGAMIFAMIASSSAEASRNEEMKQQAEAEQAKIELAKKEKELKEFNTQKIELLRKVKKNIDSKTYENALPTCNLYMKLQDKDLSPLCTEVKEAVLKKEQQARERAAAKEAAEQEAELKASMGAKAWKLHKKHPNWSIDDCKYVSEGRYWIGMSTEMMVSSLGRPNSAKPSDYGSGRQWQYCYTDGWFQCFYDKNDDGIIDSYN